MEINYRRNYTLSKLENGQTYVELEFQNNFYSLTSNLLFDKDELTKSQIHYITKNSILIEYQGKILIFEKIHDKVKIPESVQIQEVNINLEKILIALEDENEKLNKGNQNLANDLHYEKTENLKKDQEILDLKKRN